MLLNKKAVSEILQLSESSIMRLVANNQLKAVKFGGKCTMFNLADVTEYQLSPRENKRGRRPKKNN